MATIDEILEQSDEITSVCEIDPDTREILVPDEYLYFGVESDENVTRIPFRSNKIVGDNIDLSKHNLYINYTNAGGETHVYSVEDMVVDGDYITFSWLLSRNVMLYPGDVQYVVCAKTTDNHGDILTEWNTQVASGSISTGLEMNWSSTETRAYTDIIDQMLNRIAALEAQLNG